jgi:hypothetical protein
MFGKLGQTIALILVAFASSAAPAPEARHALEIRHMANGEIALCIFPDDDFHNVKCIFQDRKEFLAEAEECFIDIPQDYMICGKKSLIKKSF